MFVITILILMLLMLITFTTTSYALFLNYKKTSDAFYNYNKSLIENIAQSNDKTIINLSNIATSLNDLADNFENVDPSADLYLQRIENIEELVNQEKLINMEINKVIIDIAENKKRINHTKNLICRKFKNYN